MTSKRNIEDRLWRTQQTISINHNSMPTPEEETDAAKEKTAWDKGSSRFNSKRYSEYFDPCQEAADRSLKCMRRNGGDRAMCMDYFDAYKACKKSWMEEMKEQKRKEGKSWF